MDKLQRTRNFCIIAHIDHGKSTLADRLIEYTGQVAKRDMENQLLDSMELERERGITIKLAPVKMNYCYKGENYTLNLIDTPGHVDFNYEVSRSLAACEGALLIVDASQGVEAQTLANCYLALDNDLAIVPVINKIDLPSARPEEVRQEIEEIGLDASRAPLISAKEGINIDKVLESVIEEIPCPKGDENAPLKALIFDCVYDNYKGVLILVRIFDGKVRVGSKIKMFQTKDKVFDVTEVGIFAPEMRQTDSLSAGDVGYIAASIKTVSDTKVGDTITTADNPAAEALKGYKDVLPMVYCGIYPIESNKYPALKEAIEKLKLNDASLTFEPETSSTLGFGFRMGFLGLLHLEIISERIEREFGIEIIATTPSVNYEINLTDGSTIFIDNPSMMPDKVKIKNIKEPYIFTNILVPTDYIGPIMELCQDKRGIYKSIDYLDTTRVNIHYELPLSEIVYDFFDRLKSSTKGYASFDYEVIGYKESDLVKMDILLNGEVVDAYH